MSFLSAIFTLLTQNFPFLEKLGAGLKDLVSSIFLVKYGENKQALKDSGLLIKQEQKELKDAADAQVTKSNITAKSESDLDRLLD